MLSKDNGSNDSVFLYMVDFVLRELLNNAVEHGNGMVEEKLVSLTINLTTEELLIDVYDEGSGDKLEGYIQNQDEVETDNLRVRNRGLLSIHNFGFVLENLGGHIKAYYKIRRNFGEN